MTTTTQQDRRRPTVLRQLAALDKMSFAELKRKWKEMFGSDAPGYNRTFLIKRLSYRIQEDAYGGVSEDTPARLDQVLDAAGFDELGRPSQVKSATVDGDKMVPGTTLVRFWKEQRHVVTVLEKGFEYRGKPYRSLSAIAKEISGTKWNGPAFFGLRKKGKALVKRRNDDGI